MNVFGATRAKNGNAGRLWKSQNGAAEHRHLRVQNAHVLHELYRYNIGNTIHFKACLLRTPRQCRERQLTVLDSLCCKASPDKMQARARHFTNRFCMVSHLVRENKIGMCPKHHDVVPRQHNTTKPSPSSSDVRGSVSM